MLTVGGVAGKAGEAKGLDPRLKPAAHEFEACLMQEFLKPLQEDPLFGSGTDGSGTNWSGSGSGGSEGSLMSYGTEELAKAISERGGFGIADKIIAHFEHVEKAGSSAGTAQSNSESMLRMGRKR